MKESDLGTSRISAFGLIIAAILGVAACGSSSKTTTTATTATGTATTSAGKIAGGTINGAGSTLAAPIYQQWASTLKGQGLTVNYNPVGSGAGITQIQSTTVDFAGSDPPVTSSDQSKAKGKLFMFPVAFGAITLSYNLPGIKSGLKLDGPTIADIFSGKITTWNNSAITSLNPGLKLPSSTITVVHRSDSSGTTDGFTTFLSDVSPTWKSSVGAGKDVKWPTGTGGKGNSGVAAAVKQTSGSIGYVEQAYALENGFTYASVKNKAGSYVLPTIQNTSAAADGITVPPDLAITTINSSNPAAYPIVSQTFLVAYEDSCKAGLSSGAAASTKSFIGYAIGAGQSTMGAGSNQLPYAPLPSSIQGKDQAQLAKMVCNGAAISS
jgi:phosphate transport system substrate-binding protein